LILKTSKAFNAKTFARKTGYNAIQSLLNEFNLENIVENSFEDEFSQRYEICPEELKAYFNLINDVACEKARPQLIAYAKEFDIQHQELNVFELACFIFLKNKNMILNIFNWLNIDSIDNFREFDGLEPKEPNEKNLNIFKQELSEFFSEQGKGNQVEVDIYPKANKIAYIVNHGSYIKNEHIANDEKMTFETVKQRKAKAIFLVYLPKLARLRIKCNDFNTSNFLKNKFAEHLLEDKTFFDNADNIQYFDLEKLLSMKKEDFIANPEYGIKNVDFTRIEGTLYEDETLKGSLSSRKGLLETLNCDFDNRIKNLIPTRIHIQFKFEDGKNNKRTVQFAKPNFSNLNESKKDLIIEKCLKEWEVL